MNRSGLSLTTVHTCLSSRGATLVRISRIPPTICTRIGADIIGHSEPVLQPSASGDGPLADEPNLRPPDSGSAHSAPQHLGS